MARMRLVLGVVVPLGAIGAGVALGRSIRRQRRNPEPFPADARPVACCSRRTAKEDDPWRKS